MAKQHGVTSSTFTRFIIDAGKIYKNYGLGGEALLGATRGGNTFQIETDQREMPVDGAVGPVKGGKRIITETAMLTVNMVEFSQEVFLRALPAAVAADYPVAPATKTHDLINRTVDIASADYATNIAIVGNSTQSLTNYVIIVLENALGDGNLEVAFSDKDESVLSIKFTAHYDPSDLETVPWKIYNPVIA